MTTDAEKDNEVHLDYLLIIDQQATGTDYIPTHKFKANFLDYYEEYVQTHKRKRNRHLQNSLKHFKTFIDKKFISPIEISETFCRSFRRYLLDNFTGETPLNYFARFKWVVNAAKSDGYFRESPTREIAAQSNPSTSLKENLEAEEYLHSYLKTITPIFKKDKTEHLNLLNEFICSLFIEEKTPYCISSWLSNNLLYSQGGIDMILYPSSITDSYFTNAAVHPNFADRYLQLEKVFQFSIVSITEKKLQYGIGLIGLPGKLNIEWRRPTEIEIKEILAALNVGIAPNHDLL